MSGLFINWSEWDRKLGKKPDKALAREIGCWPSSVRIRRKKLDIPVFRRATSRRRRTSSRKAGTEPAMSNTKIKTIKLIPGKAYRSVGSTTKLVYLTDQPGAGVVHHLFRRPGGALESFVDFDLVDMEVA